MSAMRHLRRLGREERGSTLVEMAFVIPLLLLFFFILLDFGRVMHTWVMAEKATSMAARMAAVLPAVCTGVPDTNLPGNGNTAKFGVPCSGAGAVCQASITVVPPCNGSATNATANRIFTSIRPLLPNGATAANLWYRYTYDAGMNFLGGPYVPVVTVELQGVPFDFTSPLLGLARLAGAPNVSAGNRPALTLPSMSVSLPGEDLNVGMNQ